MENYEILRPLILGKDKDLDCNFSNKNMCHPLAAIIKLARLVYNPVGAMKKIFLSFLA